MVKPPAPSRPWLAVPLVAFALVSLTVGLVAHRTIKSPSGYFHLFFSDTIHMKVWLASAAVVLAVSQLVTASRVYGLLHFPPPGRLYNAVHRWSGRTAIALTLPVAYSASANASSSNGPERMQLGPSSIAARLIHSSMSTSGVWPSRLTTTV